VTASEQGLQDIAEQVDRAIAAAERLEPEARAAAGALRAALEQFHKVGLTTIVARLKADPRGKQLLFDLVDEPEVRALLSLHGLIRASATSDAVPTPPLPAAPPPPKPAPISAVIPLSALKARGSATPAPRVEQGWLPGPALEEIAETRPYRLDVRDTSLVLVRQGGRVQAYRNECAHQGLPQIAEGTAGIRPEDAAAAVPGRCRGDPFGRMREGLVP